MLELERWFTKDGLRTELVKDNPDVSELQFSAGRRL